MTLFLDTYITNLKSQYASLKTISDLQDRLRYLVTEQIVDLPRSVYNSAEDTILKIDQYAHSKAHFDRLSTQLGSQDLKILQSPAKNRSVLMAYDFHYNPQNENPLSLIEINTNASAYMLCAELYKVGDPSMGTNQILDLKQSFENERILSGQDGPVSLAIIDEHPDQQKMYPEFLIYQDLFRSWGWSSGIREANSTDLNKYNFIYNRYNDFTLNHSDLLLKQYLDGHTIFSPNPKEYILLADKQRLVDFALAHVADAIIPTYDVQKFSDKNELWGKRKTLFFKPKKLYGGKAAYRGSSISRTVFDSAINENFIAQEYSPAGTYGDFKFDLRFYCYEQKIQLVAARLYKGQVTNFGTLGGGLARVNFI